MNSKNIIHYNNTIQELLDDYLHACDDSDPVIRDLKMEFYLLEMDELIHQLRKQ